MSSTPGRLALFGVGLVGALGLGAGLGAVAGPAPAGDAVDAQAPEGVVAVVDGYQVSLDTEVEDGHELRLTLTVRKHGEVVRTAALTIDQVEPAGAGAPMEH